MVTRELLIAPDEPVNGNIEMAVSTIKVMRVQEETAYRFRTDLYQEQQHENYVGPQQGENGWDLPVDADCRLKMAEWCYHVADVCRFRREVVAIAMSHLDRFLSTEVGGCALQHRRTYQLASMTALYIAVKMNETEVMDPRIVAGLSRGVYTEKQITDMELLMIEALEWRLNPPTALSYVHEFLRVLPDDTIKEDVRKDVFEFARFQTELALVTGFGLRMSSTIAYAAVANALSTVRELPISTRRRHLKFLARILSINPDSLEVKEARQQVSRIFSSYCKRNGWACKTLAPKKMVKSTSVEYRNPSHVSPRCVGQ